MKSSPKRIMFAPVSGLISHTGRFITLGGSQTVYQTIQAGNPCIVIATHLDQEWAGVELEKHNAGIFLIMHRVLKKPELIKKALKDFFKKQNIYKENMEKLKNDLKKYNPLDDAICIIEDFIADKIS